LADRLSIFYGDWSSFGSLPPAARLGVVDRSDLMDNGVLMAGIDRPACDGVRPSRDELIAETAEFLSYWLSQRRAAEQLIAAGPRVLTKNVLFPVRFLYTHATGRAGGNQEAVDWYRELGSPHAELSIAALQWRSGDVDRVAARGLLERHPPTGCTPSVAASTACSRALPTTPFLLRERAVALMLWRTVRSPAIVPHMESASFRGLRLTTLPR
jgi:hypothetical protein